VDTLLFPALSTSQPAKAADLRPISADKAKNSNFSEYMEKKLNAERREGRDLLGASQRAGSSKRTEGRRNAGREDTEEARGNDRDEKSTLSALLYEFVQDLHKMAEDAKEGPGDWTVLMIDQSALEKIAADAGIDGAQLAALRQQLEANGGKVDLADFLSVIARHLESKQEVLAVTVPETDLPFLQILLERMGLSPGQVEKIGEPAVRGDNSLDLAKFLEGLGEFSEGKTTTLSDWEAEQLQDLLAKAGVSEKVQRSLLPELYPQWQGTPQENLELSLSLTRLKNILSDGVANVKEARARFDIPAFLQDLGEIFAQAGFEEKGAGWTPAVQGAISSIYDKLMESVDLSRVQMKKVENSPDAEALGEEEFPEDLLSPETGTKIQADKKDTPRDLAGGTGEKGSGMFSARPAEEDFLSQPAARPEASKVSTSESPFVQAQELSGNHNGNPAQDIKAVQVPRQPPAPPLQQQTFDQISQGVFRGLKNNEHHVILKLHPRELGEVKVEMLVRDEQVALSFSMENSKVKGILEKSMDQFRESLEKQGFVLGECMVSLSHDENGEQAWKQFELAWKKSGLNSTPETLADLSQDVLYLQSRYQKSSPNGIDLFA